MLHYYLFPILLNISCLTLGLAMPASSFASPSSILAVREERDGQVVKRLVEESDSEEVQPNWFTNPRETEFMQLEEIMEASTPISPCSIFIRWGRDGA